MGLYKGVKAPLDTATVTDMGRTNLSIFSPLLLLLAN